MDLAVAEGRSDIYGVHDTKNISPSFTLSIIISNAAAWESLGEAE